MLLQIAKYVSSDYTIGNSKGLLLSKTVLEKYNSKDKVEVILEKIEFFLSRLTPQGKIGKKHLRK